MSHREPGATRALAAAALALTLALTPTAETRAQVPAPATVLSSARFSQQELDPMLAPIALYPDALLAQVLMAATYPEQVLDAARFVRANRGLSGDALANAVTPFAWDPSVKALVQFPSVLTMMEENFDWTRDLGDAFLAQGEQVMDTVQALRERAYAAGSLYSGPQQQVIVQDSVIRIEPLVADAYWVPYYNPLIVYGNWWWPAHRPFLWVPPAAYRPPRFAEVYTVGIVWGASIVVRASLWDSPRPVWRGRHDFGRDRVHNVIITQPHGGPPRVWRHQPGHRPGIDRGGPIPPRARPPGAVPPHAMPPGAVPPHARPPGAVPPHALPPPGIAPSRPGRPGMGERSPSDHRPRQDNSGRITAPGEPRAPGFVPAPSRPINPDAPGFGRPDIPQARPPAVRPPLSPGAGPEQRLDSRPNRHFDAQREQRFDSRPDRQFDAAPQRRSESGSMPPPQPRPAPQFQPRPVPEMQAPRAPRPPQAEPRPAPQFQPRTSPQFEPRMAPPPRMQQAPREPPMRAQPQRQMEGGGHPGREGRSDARRQGPPGEGR